MPMPSPIHRDRDKASAFFGLPESRSPKPFIGWRTWKLKYDEPANTFRLHSVSAHVCWEGPVMTTNVMKNRKLEPVSINNKAKFSGSRGDYGVYAYKTPADLLYHHGLSDVFGQITLMGEVIEHEVGFRAQKAIIKKLWTFLDNPRIKEQLEQTYGCDVVHTIESSQDWVNEQSKIQLYFGEDQAWQI